MRSSETLDAAAAKAKGAFFGHVGSCTPYKEAWFTVRTFPDKERLCDKGKRLHASWWAIEEA